MHRSSQAGRARVIARAQDASAGPAIELQTERTLEVARAYVLGRSQV